MLVAPADPDSAEARLLLNELDAALAAITGDSGASSFDAADVQGERAVFMLARSLEGEVLGCGALRPLESDVAELKRMFARPGSGAGAQLLKALEAHAGALGYRELRLSTRRVNARAVDFYRRHGYGEVAAWRKYAGRLESICLGRALVKRCA